MRTFGAATLALGLMLASAGTAKATTTSFGYTGTVVAWKVPETGYYIIDIAGAQGGGDGGGIGSAAGGDGVEIAAQQFLLTGGEVLDIVVGGQGATAPSPTNPYFDVGGSGGGGSFLFADPIGPDGPTPLLIAGGGGGAFWSDNEAGGPGQFGTSGANGTGTGAGAGGSNGQGGGGGTNSYSGGGGAGLLSPGTAGSSTGSIFPVFVSGGGGSSWPTFAGGVGPALPGAGGLVSVDGGFGGGGAGGNYGGGGGGGYSGGGGGGGVASDNHNIGGAGGGGGSFISYYDLQPPFYRMNAGNGFIDITLTYALPEPATWALMLIGFGAIGLSMRKRLRTAAQV